MQKQLENRILEVEKMKQQVEEERRQAVDAVEKQVSLLHTFIHENLYRNGSVFNHIHILSFMKVCLDFVFFLSICKTSLS